MAWDDGLTDAEKDAVVIAYHARERTRVAREWKDEGAYEHVCDSADMYAGGCAVCGAAIPENEEHPIASEYEYSLIFRTGDHPQGFDADTQELVNAFCDADGQPPPHVTEALEALGFDWSVTARKVDALPELKGVPPHG